MWRGKIVKLKVSLNRCCLSVNGVGVYIWVFLVQMFLTLK